MSNPLRELDLVGAIDTVEVTIKVFSEDHGYHCYIYEPIGLPRGERAGAVLRNVEISPKNEDLIGMMRLQSLTNLRTRISFDPIEAEAKIEGSVERFAEYCSKLLNYLVMGGFTQVYIDRTGTIGLRMSDYRER